MDEQRIYRRKNEMLQRDLDTLTTHKMQTYEQFRQNQFREAEQGGGFVAIEEQKDRFYSMDRVEENTLMIDRLLNNANQLQLSTAQREDLGIRRNRVKDFELLNNRTKEDSKEMRLLKEEIRNYDLLLSWTPHNIQECMQYCAMAQQKCEDAIKRCDDYLDKGKSLKFWKKNRNERYDMVKETKARYLRDKQRFTDLLEKPDMEQLMRNGDTMLDLMNYEAIKERHQQEQERQRQAEEEQRRREEDRRAGEEQAEGVNGFFAGVEEQQQREEERKEMEEQAEGVNDLFVDAEKQVKEQQEQQQQQQQQQEQQNQEQQQEQKKEEQQQQQLFRDQELKKLEAGNTPEIIAVRNAITSIQTEMAKPMPPVSVTGDMKADRKAERRVRKRSVDGKEGIDEFCAKMVKKFSILQNSIDDCLKKANGDGYGQNNALKDILEQLRDVTKKDRTLFRDKVLSYRASLAENANEAVKAHTWCDAWKYVRAVAYDLDDNNNGLETKITGAGASMITVITDTKKKETVYFRKGENAGGMDATAFVDDFMKSIEGEFKGEDTVKNALQELFRSLVTDEVLSHPDNANSLDNILNKYRAHSDFDQTMLEFIEKTDKCTDNVKNLFYKPETTKETKEIMGKALALFARKFFQWNFSKRCAKINPNDSLTDRNVATSRLAAALGISSMVSDSRTAVIKKDGKEIMGNVMEDSRGQTKDSIKEDWSYSNKAIGQLFTLQVFDILCGQIDRHHDNYHVITKKKGDKLVVNSVRAIDNDMSFGTSYWDDLANGYQRMAPLSECHIRSMPIDVINTILALDKTALQELLGDLLNNGYIDHLEYRLVRIQDAIRKHAEDPESGLIIDGDGKAMYTGEDADDELRMLKAVKKFKAIQDQTDGGVIRFDGEEMELTTEFDDEFTKGYTSLIDWDHLTLKDIQNRIEERRKQL